MLDIFYDGYENLVKTAINAPILYVAVVLMIRIAGKRSTAQMNNFDWIVTVAMGSLVGSGLVLEDVTLAETVFAIFALMALQYLFTLSAYHEKRFESLIKAQPRLLLARGRLLHDKMRQERVTESELMAALRNNGLYRLEDAQWVILESDASFSVVAMTEQMHDPTALSNVSGL